MQISSFTGGIFDTNCFLIEQGDDSILIDAPQECAEWLARTGKKVGLLLLTHCHIDHVLDAARVKQEHHCIVAYHREGQQMMTEPDFFRRFGLDIDIDPVAADFFIDEAESEVLSGIEFKVLYVPGHCPGSLCFLAAKERILFGGDVLFAGGIGRWDLPGGNRDLLLQGITQKVLPLGDDVKVLAGHGPATTIGAERATNPFLNP